MRFARFSAATLVALFSVPAFAADIGNVEPLPTPPTPVEAAPRNNWSGFYLGALLGWTWGTANTDLVGDIDGDGIDGGAYAGANWQFGNFVVGAEGDILFSGVDGEDAGVEFDQGLNGSLRARAGIALDRFLIYGTGGAALTNLELSNAAGSDDQTLWGWTAGAGAEALVTDNITARVEYRYTDYQDETFTLGGADVDSDLTSHSVRAGVGVKF